MKAKTIPRSNGKKHPGGRPSTVSRLAPGFLKHIESGQTIVAAAALSGIGQSTVFNWLATARNAREGEYREFMEAFTRARGRAEGKMVQEIRKAGQQDWRAISWLLERMSPERFCVKQLLEVSGPDGAPITVQQAEPLIRVLSIDDCEFAECQTRSEYKPGDNGQLVRYEGTMKIILIRQSATRPEDL